jgi:predicted nucleic-acid-binding protein
MKSFVIDTNCILSYFTERNPHQQAIMAPYFQQCANGEAQFLILENVKVELVYVLDTVYKVQKATIGNLIRDLFDSPGIGYAPVSEPKAELALWPEKVKDHTDAVLAQYAKTRHVPILTFDREFAGQLKKLAIKHLLLK